MARMPPAPGFTWRDVARYVPAALIAGASIAFAMAGFKLDGRQIVVGMVIGLSCFAAAITGERLFQPWFQKAPEQWWRRAFVYFAASQVAWPLGLLISVRLIFGVPMNRIKFGEQAFYVAIGLGGAGTAIGLGIQTYEKLKERLRVSVEQLKEAEFAEKELELARELQARMLPAPEIAAAGYRITGRNYAARYVAGDFFDVFRYGDGSLGIAVADVAGKGLAASLIMASVKAVLPLLATERGVDEAMNALNMKLAGELSKREFVALVLARFNPLTGDLALVNAGLPDPYLIHSDGNIEVIEASGPRLPLGLRRNICYEKREVVLGFGDALLMLSDGLPEATTTDGEQLGYERLKEIITAAGADIDAILAQVQAVTTELRDDDQTVVIIERTASEGVTSSIPRIDIAPRSPGSQSARVSESQS